MRPSRHEMFMQVAHVVQQRATCERLRVGCVITNHEGTSIVSMGYNGNARELTNGCDNPNQPGGCGCLHAEENALLKAPYGEALTLYTTASPCLMCAKRILNSKVTTVFYDEEYRDSEPIKLLDDHGIKIYHESGIGPWQRKIRELHDHNDELSQIITHYGTALKMFMAWMFPKWRPGRGEHARQVFGEREIQKILGSDIRVSNDREHGNGLNLVVELM